MLTSSSSQKQSGIPLDTKNQYLTPEEVASLLRLEGKDPIRTVRRYAAQGIIKARQINRVWRFHPQAISDYLLGRA